MEQLPPKIAAFAEGLREELMAIDHFDEVLVDQVVNSAVRIKLLLADPRAYKIFDNREWDKAHAEAGREFFRNYNALIRRDRAKHPNPSGTHPRRSPAPPAKSAPPPKPSPPPPPPPAPFKPPDVVTPVDLPPRCAPARTEPKRRPDPATLRRRDRLQRRQPSRPRDPWIVPVSILPPADHNPHNPARASPS